LKSFAQLVFPNSRKSVDLKESKQKDEQNERGLISSMTHGLMSGMVHYYPVPVSVLFFIFLIIVNMGDA
jgi:nucleoside permease NupC